MREWLERNITRFRALHKDIVHSAESASTACPYHYDDVIMSAIASQITGLTIVYSTVYPGADQSKHQSSASLAFVWGIHRGPVNSPHKWPVTRKMFPFDDVIMIYFTGDGVLLWLVTGQFYSCHLGWLHWQQSNRKITLVPVNPLYAKFFRVNIIICLHFMPFLHIDMT